MNTEKDRIISELLLVRHRRGDSTALGELIRLWEDRLFYYISRLVNDHEDAWDALQDTWLALIRGVGGLRDRSSFVPWLYKTARHKAMDKLRAKCDDRTVSMDCGDIPDGVEAAEEFAFEDAELAHGALARLSLCHREVLTLHFLEDLSIQEVSEVLAIAPGTVKSRLHYAKKALKTILEEEVCNNEQAQ